jgi:hypothetical protein
LLLIGFSIFLFAKPDLFQPKTVASAPLDNGKNISGDSSIAAVPKITPQGETHHLIDQSKVSLKNYYDLLNGGNIDIAWNYLSSNIKLKLFKDTSHTPVDDYRKWWKQDVHSIEVVSLEHVEGYPTSTDSKIEARLVYILKGRIKCLDDHSIFHLKKGGVGWVMFDKNRVSERPKVRSCL